MPKINQEHREARRRQILEAAMIAFSRSGLRRTSMADIVRESGLSFGGIYGYFGSKDEIIRAVADDRNRVENDLHSRALALSDPVAALRELMRAYGRWLADPDERVRHRVGVQLWAEALCNEGVRARVSRGAEVVCEVIVALLRRAHADSRLVDGVEAASCARALVALFHGYTLQLTLDQITDPERCMTEIQEMLEAMLRPEGPDR